MPPTRSGITDYAQIFQSALKVKNRINIDTCVFLSKHDIKSTGIHAVLEIWKKIRTLAQNARLKQYNIVWVEAGRHNAFELVVGYFMSVCAPDIRLILTVHDPPFLTRSISKYFRFSGIIHIRRLRALIDNLTEKVIISRAALIFALSMRGKKAFLANFSVDNNKVYVLPHVAFDSTEVIQKRKTDLLKIQPHYENIYFKTFGFFSENKGIDILLYAYRKFLDRKPRRQDETLLIIGGGGLDNTSENAYLQKLKHLTSALKLDGNVKYTGYLAPNDLSTFLNSADIFVIPYSKTFNHSSSGVLMRVLTAGAPVIVSDVNTFGEVIEDGVNGLLVPPGNADTLAEAMCQLYNNHELMTALRINSLDFILQKHCWEIIEEDLVKSLFQAC